MAEVVRHSPTMLQQINLESIAGMSFRALVGSNHEVRCAVAHLLGQTAAAAVKVASVEEVLSIISTGFLRGGDGFLKGEMIKYPVDTRREVRVGVTMVIFYHHLADNSILINQSKRRN